jgi:hypothetical protein
MAAHDALGSKDIKLLFEAFDGDGVIVVEKTADRDEVVHTNGQPVPEVDRTALDRLAACGYVEGGPDRFTLTQAGREYAESMN